MTETQLILLRDWFREEMEYVIRKEIFPEKHRMNDNPTYWADKAFNDVVVEFCGEDI